MKTAKIGKYTLQQGDYDFRLFLYRNINSKEADIVDKIPCKVPLSSTELYNALINYIQLHRKELKDVPTIKEKETIPTATN